LAVAAMLMGASPDTGTEPVFDGKPMSFWIDQLRKLPTDEKKESLEAGRASHALARIGPPAINPLVDALSDRNSVVRRRAAMSLAIMGRPAIGGAMALTKALQDPDIEVRQAAAIALGRIGASGSSTAALVRALQDKEPRVQVAAATSLGVLGAKEAAPALTDAARDGHPALKKAAAQALHRLEGKKPSGPAPSPSPVAPRP
jgi:HEAT repeat protein